MLARLGGEEGFEGLRERPGLRERALGGDDEVVPFYARVQAFHQELQGLVNGLKEAENEIEHAAVVGRIAQLRDDWRRRDAELRRFVERAEPSRPVVDDILLEVPDTAEDLVTQEERITRNLLAICRGLDTNHRRLTDRGAVAFTLGLQIVSAIELEQDERVSPALDVAAYFVVLVDRWCGRLIRHESEEEREAS